MGMGSGHGRWQLSQHSQISRVVETERNVNPIPLRTLVMAMLAFVMCQVVMLGVGALDIVGWWWANNEVMGLGSNGESWSWVATVGMYFTIIASTLRTITHTGSLGIVPCFLISACSC